MRACVIGQCFACELEIASGPATIVGARETRDFGHQPGRKTRQGRLGAHARSLSSQKVERLRR
jgi:hypothetical protein